MLQCISLILQKNAKVFDAGRRKAYTAEVVRMMSYHVTEYWRLRAKGLSHDAAIDELRRYLHPITLTRLKKALQQRQTPQAARKTVTK